ncbi:MAG: sulfite exporter TauE/SafE family protein, partial [Actinomycetota bacterium]|nr:sulfite exporter TauE/SafE family protein [Actinomycetota bacterium]
MTMSVAHAAHHAHHVTPVLLAMAGLVGGCAVGLTGMGGGALMTPALVLLFKVDPKVAVASDLVNSLVMKPIGGAVHFRRGNIQWPLVGWLVLGSVPAAFFGAFLLNRLGDSKHVQTQIKELLGWALIVASTAIVAKSVLGARARRRMAPGEEPNDQPHSIKAVPTVLVGVVGGVIVGMTSVGSGSLMIVLLMLLYPRLSSRSLVGTDLVQAIPLVASAALGQLAFGHIDFGLAGALILGSIPGVYLGARFSALAPDSIVRPVLVAVLVASALALLFGSNYTVLGWALLVASTAIVAKAVLTVRARRRMAPGEQPNEQPHSIKPVPTLLVGVVGGVIVGMTSVGSGSLMIVLLMLLYPRLSSRSLVGTDLV